MHPGANLQPDANLLYLSRWCKFGEANKHPGANCAHERNLSSQMYNLDFDFDKFTIFSKRPCIIQYENEL